ncbi:hypothetical protein ELH30_31685 (plasmid) [Rhizobium ruizarguesonis]|nr:hypothetical protein ELH30_31685 [Rhizobium ruizarguesonis]
MEFDRSDGDLTACAAREAYYLWCNLQTGPSLWIEAAGKLAKVWIEILPPDRETFTADSTTCPCCRKIRPASSMDDDGCGICDECLAP